MKHALAIMRCDRSGLIVDVLHEGGHLVGFVKKGRALTALANRDSFSKVLDFIADLRRDGFAYDCEVCIDQDSDTSLYRLSGGSDDGGLTVAMIPADCHADLLIEEMTKIGNDQAATLRQLLKERAAKDTSLLRYDSVTKINNDLVSAQRELAKTNARLKDANDKAAAAALLLKSANEELLVARDMAEAANHAKSAFLAMMSHELRTPLNSVLGFAELIQDESFGPVGAPQYVEYSGYILESGRHLLNLLNDILDLAKIEAGKLSIIPTAQPVGAVISDCARVFSLRAKKQGLALTSEIADVTTRVLVDDRAIRQLMAPLVYAIPIAPSI